MFLCIGEDSVSSCNYFMNISMYRDRSKSRAGMQAHVYLYRHRLDAEVHLASCMKYLFKLFRASQVFPLANPVASSKV